MQIADFLASVQATLQTGNATEHSYRSAIEALMNGLSEQVTAINEPKREKNSKNDIAEALKTWFTPIAWIGTFTPTGKSKPR